MRLSRSRATVGGATALITASMGVGYVFAASGEGGAQADAQSAPPKPVVRTQVIRRTVHVVRHRKPPDPKPAGGGTGPATTQRSAPQSPVIRVVVTGAGGPGPGSAPATSQSATQAKPEAKSRPSTKVSTKTSGSQPTGGKKKHHKKHRRHHESENENENGGSGEHGDD
jgi:hypothetical protein